MENDVLHDLGECIDEPNCKSVNDDLSSSDVESSDDCSAINDGDLLSSDCVFSDDCNFIDNGNFTKRKQCNQLNPRAKLIYKLLKSVKPSGSIWKTINGSNKLNISRDEILNQHLMKLALHKMAHTSKKRRREEDSYDEIELHQTKKGKKHKASVVSSRTKVNRKERTHSMSSTDGEGLIEQDAGDKLGQKCSETNISLDIIAQNSKKRKHEKESYNNEIENHQPKKVKKHNSSDIAASQTEVSRKKQTHSVSSSENEGVDHDSVNNHGQKKHTNTNAGVENIYNGHITNSESDGLSDDDKRLYQIKHNKDNNQNHIVSDVNKLSDDEKNSIRSIGDTDDESKNSDHEQLRSDKSSFNSLLNSKPIINNQRPTKTVEKVYREHRFTLEDEEEISKYSTLLSENLTEKNNVWILQCPSNVDSASLVGQQLNLNGSCQLKDGLEAYSYRGSTSRSVTMAIPSQGNRFHLCRIPITGNLIIEETVSFNSDVSVTIPEAPSIVELPDNLKTRHPLLGLDYKKQSKTVVRTVQIKKNKKLPKLSVQNAEDVAESELESSSNFKNIKKKRKKKHRYTGDSADTNVAESELDASCNFGSIEKKKKKKHRHKENSADTSLAEQILDTSTEENSKKKKKKKRHCEESP